MPDPYRDAQDDTATTVLPAVLPTRDALGGGPAPYPPPLPRQAGGGVPRSSWDITALPDLDPDLDPDPEPAEEPAQVREPHAPAAPHAPAGAGTVRVDVYAGQVLISSQTIDAPAHAAATAPTLEALDAAARALARAGIYRGVRVVEAMAARVRRTGLLATLDGDPDPIEWDR